MSAGAPWAELADLAERELAFARDGRWDDVATCSHERARRAAALPGTPPAQAAGALARMVASTEALMAVLTSAHALTARELAAVRRGRGAAIGYASAAGAGAVAGRVDGRG